VLRKPVKLTDQSGFVEQSSFVQQRFHAATWRTSGYIHRPL